MCIRDSHQIIFKVLADIAARTGRQIKRYHAEPAVVCLNPTALTVEISPTQTFPNPVGLAPAIKSNTAIAGLFRVDVAICITLGEKARVRSLKGLNSGLLKTDEISTLLRQPFEEPFPGSRTDAIAV